MFDWLKRKKSDATPRWSQVLNARQEERFEELVNARLAADGESARIEGGRVALRGTTFGFENLAQVCHSLPPDDWPRAIGDHFDAMARAEAEGREWQARKHDFGWVAPQLCVRLHADEYAGADGRPIVVGELSPVRCDLPGLSTALVADRPSTIVTVERETAAAWGRGEDELFALALANLASRQPVEVEAVDLDPQAGTRVHVMSGEHMFVASHALRIDAFPELIGAHGTLLAIPNRHTLIAYPVESAAMTGALQALSWLAYRTCAEGPGSIAPHLYWRTREGRFEVMTVAVEDQSVVLKPTDAFVELLNALPA